MFSRRSPGSRRGHTLLELVSASALVAIAITTTLTVMGTALDLSVDTENRRLATTLCVSKLEEHLASVTHGFTEGTFNGDFTTDGYATVKYSVTRSMNPASGGIAGSLMVIQATVWFDGNSDGTVSSAEPFATMTTKVANVTAWTL